MSGIDKVSGFAMESANFDKFSRINQKTAENVEQIKKLSDEFEGIFMEIVLKSMRDTVDKSAFIDGGNGEQIFQSMLDSEYAKNIASQRSTGLAASIEQHLLGMMGETKVSDAVQKAQGKAQYNKAK